MQTVSGGRLNPERRYNGDPRLRPAIEAALARVQNEFNDLRLNSPINSPYVQQRSIDLLSRANTLDASYSLYDTLERQQERERQQPRPRVAAVQPSPRAAAPGLLQGPLDGRPGPNLDVEKLKNSRSRGGYLASELVGFAADLGVLASGTKTVLVDRILPFYQAGPSPAATSSRIPRTPRAASPSRPRAASPSRPRAASPSRTPRAPRPGIEIDVDKLEASRGRGANTYTLTELRALARDLGVPQSGNKSDLVDRLWAQIAA